MGRVVRGLQPFFGQLAIGDVDPDGLGFQRPLRFVKAQVSFVRIVQREQPRSRSGSRCGPPACRRQAVDLALDTLTVYGATGTASLRATRGPRGPLAAASASTLGVVRICGDGL
jgi:hypothetical protein